MKGESKKQENASRLIGPEGQRVFVSVICRDSMEPHEIGVMRNRVVAIKLNDRVYHRAGVDVDGAADWALTQLKADPRGFDAAARAAGVWTAGKVPTIHLMVVLMSYAHAFEIRWDEVKPSSLQRAWAMDLLPQGTASAWNAADEGALAPSLSDSPADSMRVIDAPPLTPELRMTLRAVAFAGMGGTPIDSTLLNPFETVK